MEKWLCWAMRRRGHLVTRIRLRDSEGPVYLCAIFRFPCVHPHIAALVLARSKYHRVWRRFSGRTDWPLRCPYGILSPLGGRSLTMQTILWLLRPLGDARVQDFIEYVLLAGFVAAAAAAFIFPV